MEMKAGADDDGRRLDRVLRKALPDCPLSLIHRLLRQGKITLDGEPAGPGAKVWPGAEIRAEIAGAAPGPRRRLGASAPADSGPPKVVARGAGVVFFDKPAGLASQGPGSLDEVVKARFAGGPRESLSFAPGPLHRLDRPTSGLIAFSESLAGARLFSGLLRERKIIKSYLAIVEGPPAGDGAGIEVWLDALTRDGAAKRTLVSRHSADGGQGRGAKDARTEVRTLAVGRGRALIEARILTGRTHQIRAQAAARGRPLAGDAKYGGRPIPGGGFFLHAWKIEFESRIAGLPGIVEAPPPPRFVAEALRLFGPGAKGVLP